MRRLNIDVKEIRVKEIQGYLHWPPLQIVMLYVNQANNLSCKLAVYPFHRQMN